MGKIVNFAEHQAVKQTRIAEQQTRAEQALLQASVEFKKLSALKGDRR